MCAKCIDASILIAYAFDKLTKEWIMVGKTHKLLTKMTVPTHRKICLLSPRLLVRSLLLFMDVIIHAYPINNVTLEVMIIRKNVTVKQDNEALDQCVLHKEQRSDGSDTMCPLQGIPERESKVDDAKLRKQTIITPTLKPLGILFIVKMNTIEIIR